MRVRPKICLLVSSGLAASLIGALPLPTADAARPAVTCGSTITASIRLRANLDCAGLGSGGAVLTVAADGITVDLNGYAITGTRRYDTVIDIEGRSRVKVRRGSIEGGTKYGIRIDHSRTVSIERVRVHGSGLDGIDFGSGIELNASRDIELHEVQAEQNRADAVHAHNTHKVRVHRSSLSNNAGDGFFANSASSDIRIHRTTISGSNGGDGIDLDTVDDVELHDSSVSGNLDNGVEITGSSGMRLHKLTVQGNGRHGVYLAGSSFEIHRITASSNTEDGIRVQGAAPFRIRHLRSTGNGGSGVRVEGNTGSRADYIVEHAVAQANTRLGFDVVPGTVTGRKSRASGNTLGNLLP